MTGGFAGKDVYVRVVDMQTGAVTATSHRAWDVSRFMAAQQQQFRDADKKDNTPGRHVVDMIDEQKYRAITNGLKH